MRNICVSILAVTAAFACSAIAAKAAFAEDEWLVNSLSVAEALPAESEGDIELWNYVSSASNEILTKILCSVIFDGTVESEGFGLVTDLLNLLEEEIGALGDTNTLALNCEVIFDAGSLTDCKVGTLAQVWPTKLSLELSLSWETLRLLHPNGKTLEHLKSRL